MTKASRLYFKGLVAITYGYISQQASNSEIELEKKKVMQNNNSDTQNNHLLDPLDARDGGRIEGNSFGPRSSNDHFSGLAWFNLRLLMDAH